VEKSPDAFRTISEVADHLDTPAHVLRFWESRFPQIRPVKRAGGRRYYRPSDVALLAGIRRLLHDEGLTIRGVQKILREQGVRHVAGLTEEEVAADDGVVAAPPPRKAAPRSAPIPFPATASAPPAAVAQEPPPAEPRAAEPPTQLPLFADRNAEGDVPADDDGPDLVTYLRRLPPGALAPRRDAIAPLADQLRGLADTLAARARDPRL
jgi:DNA-binding transcriptional MerR regulator